MAARSELNRVVNAITDLSKKGFDRPGHRVRAPAVLPAAQPRAKSELCRPRKAHENTRRGGYFQEVTAITYSRLATTIGRAGLTTVFGMVTGVSLHALSPQGVWYRAEAPRQAKKTQESQMPRRRDCA